MACRVLTNSFFLLIFVTVASGTRNRSRWKLVIHGVSRVDYASLWRGEVGARSAWTIIKTQRRGQAGCGVSIWSREDGREARGGFTVFRRCRRFGLVCGFRLVSAQIFLHLSKLLFLASLLKVEQLHFSLEASLLFAETFVFELLLLQL